MPPKRKSQSAVGRSKSKGEPKSEDDSNSPPTPIAAPAPLLELVLQPASAALTCKYLDVAVRNQISRKFELKKTQGLDSIVFNGRRHQKRSTHNLAIFSKAVAKELAAGILQLSSSLGGHRRGNARPISLTLHDCLPSSLGIEALQRMDLLRHLDVSDNPIGPSGAGLLAQYLQDNSSLQSLSVSNCSLVGVRVARMRVEGELNLDGFRSLLFALAVHPVLTKLDLSGNYLGGTSTGNTSGSLQRAYGYSSSSCCIQEYGRDNMKILAYFLQINRTIVSLNINNNGFEDSIELSSLILREAAEHPTCTSLLGSGDRTAAMPPAGPAATLKSIALAGINYNSFPQPLPPLTTLAFKNAGLASFTGRLLGSESCLFGHVVSLDLSENLHFGDAGLVNFCNEVCKRDRGHHSAASSSSGSSGSSGSSSSSSPRACTSLRHLVLRRAGLTATGMSSLCTLLARVPITSLDLFGNALQDTGAAILCAGLLRNKSVTSLDLGSASLTAASAAHVSRLLAHNSVLACLDLSQNDIGDTGILALQAVLSNQTTQAVDARGAGGGGGLQSLILGCAEVLSRGAQAFASILSANKALQYLSLQGNVLCGRRAENTFDPTPVINIGHALHACNRSLTCLNLSKSDIGARSTRRLMSALIANQHIHTLIIDGCNISEEGAVHIGEALPDLSGLRTLQVSSCGVGPVGCQSFFLGMAENTSITALDMSGNQLTGYVFGDNNNTIEFCLQAVTAISDGIARNKVLRCLNLSNNRLFGLSQDRHVGTEGDLMPAAIVKMAEGIFQNGSEGGQLHVLNILENRLSSTCEQSCGACIDAYCLMHDSFEGRVTEMPAFTDAACKKCRGTEEVELLLLAASSHPLLSSVLGIMPTAKHANLAALRCCDHTMRLLAQELVLNQTVTSVDLENNGISDRGVRVLMQAVQDNVALKRLRLPVPEPPGLSMKEREKFDEEAADIERRKLFQAACLQSFNKRVTLAVFAHGFSYLGAAAVRSVLEYAVGPGDMVDTFLRWRIVWTALPRYVWFPEVVDEADGAAAAEEVTRSLLEETEDSQSRSHIEEDDAGPRGVVVDKHPIRRRLTYIN